MTDIELDPRIRPGGDSTHEFKQIFLSGSRVTSPGRSDFAAELTVFANGRA